MTRENEKRRHSKPSAPSSAPAPADSDESPRAAKRDGKPATERHILAAHDQDAPTEPADHRGRRRRLQDPLPLEETPRRGDGRASFHQHPQQHQQHQHQHQHQHQQHSLVVSGKDFVEVDAPAAPVNPTYVPRSGYYFQHDDRTGPLPARVNKRREYDRDSRMEPRAKARYDDAPRDGKSDYHGHRRERHEDSSQTVSHTKRDDAWAHDKFLESQKEDLERKQQQITTAPERARHTGRREFRETPPARTEKVVDGQKGVDDPDKRAEKRYPEGDEKRSEKRYPDMNLAQRERERYHERGADMERGRWMDSDSQRGRFNPRRSFSRYMGDGDRVGRRFDPLAQNTGSNVAIADKWSHDRFEDLNRSPNSQQEEDSIAQIEALLAA